MHLCTARSRDWSRKVERVSVKRKPAKVTSLAPSMCTIAESSGATTSFPALPSVVFGQKDSVDSFGSKNHSPLVSSSSFATDRQTGRQADRQTDRQTDRQADRQTDRQADTQTHRVRERKRESQRERVTDLHVLQVVVVAPDARATRLLIAPVREQQRLGAGVLAGHLIAPASPETAMKHVHDP
jgi:hypothetical protein